MSINESSAEVHGSVSRAEYDLKSKPSTGENPLKTGEGGGDLEWKKESLKRETREKKFQARRNKATI